MNTREIMDEVWTRLGEPSDLNPETFGSDGWNKLLVGVNKAVMAVANWKDGLYGRQLRFNQRIQPIIVTATPHETTALAGSTAGTITLAALPTGETDLTDCVVEVNGEQRLVIATTGTIVYLGDDLSAAPDAGDAVTVYMKWIRIPTTYRLLNVTRVDDITNGAALERASEIETFVGNEGQLGTPALFQRIETRRLLFDVACQNETRFRVWLHIMPPLLVDPTDEPDLPENFHEGICQWALYWGYQWMQEDSAAYAALKRFETFMKMTVNELDVIDDMTAPTFSVRAI